MSKPKKKPVKQLFRMNEIKKEGIKKNEADFHKKWEKASSNAQLIYNGCLENINRYREETGRIAVVMKLDEKDLKTACEAAMLLTHPRNGYEALVEVEVDWIHHKGTIVKLVVTHVGVYED